MKLHSKRVEKMQKIILPPFLILEIVYHFFVPWLLGSPKLCADFSASPFYARLKQPRMKTTLETSGEDRKTTLETSGEDGKTTLETSGEDGKTKLETSGEDVPLNRAAIMAASSSLVRF